MTSPRLRRCITPDARSRGIGYSRLAGDCVPPGGPRTANGGTEYFLSALDFAGTLDNRIAVWALTKTARSGGKRPRQPDQRA